MTAGMAIAALWPHCPQIKTGKNFSLDVEVPRDIAPWRVAVVLAAKGKVAELGFAEGENGTLAVADIDWAKPVLAEGKLGPAPEIVTERRQ